MSDVKMYDEFSQEQNGDSNRFGELQFTGNWFIDAGILGFVNLMEEVYGWDLETLRKFALESTNDRLYSVFAYAFWYKVIKDTTKRWLERDIFKSKDLKRRGVDPQELIKNIENEILDEIHRRNESLRANVVEGKNPNDVILSLNEFVKNLIRDKLSEYESHLKKVFAQNKKTILAHSSSIGIIAYLDFFTNLGIFNPSSNVAGKEKDILSIFERLVVERFVRRDKKIKNLPVNVLDKSLSPFIYSASDFPNEYYGSPMTLRTLEMITAVSPVIYILCVPFSFVWIMGKNYLFYSPNLEFSYHVNKKLRKYAENAADLSNYGKSIFKITWNAIVDTLIEFKSQYSLENMYIMEFSGIQNQQLQNVDYVGISKLQATIILDDTLRDALNKNVAIRASNGKVEERTWLLGEFIKCKPLLPYLIYHVHIYLAERINRRDYSGKRTLVYASIVDAKIREFGDDNRLFGEGFFDKYRELLTEIKDDARWAFTVVKTIDELFKTQDERVGYANLLLKAIKRDDKYRFVNTILKAFVEKKVEEKVVKNLTGYIFSKILPNDMSWKNYALILIAGLIGGGESDGEE